jgi:hypothetical protein
MPSLKVFVVLVAGLCLVGCSGNDDVAPTLDAGADVGPDVVADVGPDVVADVGADRGADRGADVVADAGADVGPDVVVDGGAEAGPSACAKCTANEICVAGYDGTCLLLGVRCLPKTAACASATCSLDCNSYLCGAGSDGGVPFSCTTAHCTGSPLVAGAVGCYGP